MTKIDFRSDTVTQPTEAMRQAMLVARVGDDVYGDDPTTKELEQLAADMFGKEAALLVPSGTFGNQLAILTQTQRGNEVLVGDSCHIVMHEVGGAGLISGVQLRQFSAHHGFFDVDAIESMIREDDIHYPETALICIENAHSDGTVIPVEEMKRLYIMAQKHGIPVHLDGARVFNAAAKLETSVRDIAQYADTIMFCLSKGLCAPIGSMLVGSHAFIEKARKYRKLLGGGLRQSGFIAAAGIVALTEMTNRLSKDHAHATLLAALLKNVSGVQVFEDMLDINMVFCRLKMPLSDDAFVAKMSDEGYCINGPESGVYRFVTHHGINEADIHAFVMTLSRVLEGQ